MLKKRARSIQKGQQMGQITLDGGFESYIHNEISGQRQKTHSFFNVPGLFVGLSSIGVSDCDSLNSPTSPLDFKVFSNVGSSFRFPKPSLGNNKCWVCGKVGLGCIVDSVDDDHDVVRNLSDNAIASCNGKTILFGSQIRSKVPNALFCEAPKSLPKDCPSFRHVDLMRSSNLRNGSSDILFEIGENHLESDPKIQSFSLDSKRLGSEIDRLRSCNTDVRTNTSSLKNETFDPSNGFSQSLASSEIELSEDYTCVISHGPNPKTTHIFGDRVLECHPNGIDSNKVEISETRIPCLEIPSPSPTTCLSNDFLSCCYFCKKKLEEGKDIYMYRGEKAFCSWECRLEEISIEEEKDKHSHSISEPKTGDEIFDKSLFVAI